MAATLKIKNSSTPTTAPAGLTAGEMAINLADKKLYVGGTAGTNTIFLDSTAVAVLGTANTFTALNSFSAGISASGATFSGSISGATATFSKDIKVNTMTVGLGKSSDTTNVAIGVGALASDTSDYDTEGVQNTAIGGQALNANTTGSSNVGVGHYALFTNTTGVENVGVGTNAFYTNTTGSSNVGVGTNALFQNTTGSSNIGVGTFALTLNNTGSSNVGVGTNALFYNTTGSNKTAIGHFAGGYRGTGADSLTTGTGGIYIGYLARGSTNGQTNEIVIGSNALALGSNTAVIGATSQTAATIYGVLNLPSGLSASGATFTGLIQIPINTAPAIKIGNHASKNLTLASIDAAGEIVQSGASNSQLNIRQASGGSVSIGDYAGTNNSTYINVQDVDTLISLNAGEIQINGAISTPLVLGSALVLANAESIKNTTNGRIDFMPGPTGGTAYGFYADVANWGYGVQMGTINSAGTIDSSPGGILFMDRVTFLQDKFIGFASDGSKGLITTTQGLDTLQIAVSPGAANSNAVAIVETNYAGTTNRSPVTSHTNPNLYIYRAGNTGANDFIRIEHDGTNGNIVAGGTSGIKISGLLDVASGLSAAGATFSGPIISTGYQISSGAINGQTGSYSLVAGDNGKIVTMNVASANNLTVPASLAVGFNCTVIQLGAGQTTILASGTTLNSYQSYLKISGQHGSASIVGYTSNVYNVAGNLSA